MDLATRRALLRSHARTCAGKFPFHDKAAAKRSIRHSSIRKKLNVYLCDNCDEWHVGIKPKRPGAQH